MKDLINIPLAYISTMEKILAVQTIANKSSAPGLLQWKGSKYVITGFMGAGDGKTYKCFYGNRVIPKKQYNGDVPPMIYDDAVEAAYKGERPRGYYGCILFVGIEEYVITESVTFVFDEEKQLTLF